MLSFLKKKKSAEDTAHYWVKHTLPKAIAFYHTENEHVRTPLVLKDKDLMEVGAGMCLFYLAEHLPDDKVGNKAKIGRVYSQIKKEFREQGLNKQKPYDFWKIFTDAFILHRNLGRQGVAERFAWERLMPERKFSEKTALHAFCYFLYLQIEDLKDMKIT